MPRAVNDTRLNTRTARLKLAVQRHPYKREIERGLILLYYRGKRRGSWSVRYYDTHSAKYYETKLGLADDYRDADGTDVLDFSQAQTLARNHGHDGVNANQRKIGPYTVGDAVDDYLEWFKVHRKSYNDTKSRLTCHVLPHFKTIPVDKLTKDQLEKWHRGLAQQSAQLRSPKDGKKNYRKTSDPRARKVTANRMLSYLRAVLNRALSNKKVKCDPVWNDIEAFKGVETERMVYLKEDEAIRLINAASDELKPLIQAGLYTGCRFSELANLKSQDYDPTHGQLFIEKAKSSRTRYVPLNQEGKSFFKRMVIGKKPEDFIFTRKNGQQWKQGYNKLFDQAKTNAKVNKDITFHSLRHSYASLLINEGVPLKVISELLGHHSTSVTERYYTHLSDQVKKRAVELYLPTFSENETDNISELSVS
ncbi:MAG: hypothetical protein DHS20C09_00010 [marine bacterium B5-7]|nr:MAG: hypothetical protein DHS20C09_00010 [marine bacterium B5-7]